LVGFGMIYHQSEDYLQNKNTSILPVVALISGWGLLTIWRLTPSFGMRQTAWLAISLLVLFLGLRLPSDLSFLRRYKYIWLTSGLLLTAFTLIFGTNPMGYGPRLWLGCCGIYLQPSEPLKLLLIIYLAAYFADWSSLLLSKRTNQEGVPLAALKIKPSTYHFPQIHILMPTLIMSGLAILLILVQRDLGTAFIFIFIYSVMLYLATGWGWVPFASLGILSGAGFLGYLAFDVIRLRVDAWINPWQDPTGRSFQIVQSLLAIANGGMFGRGPGLGNPSLVPVAHSDFVFASIAEEGGMVSIVGLLVLLGLLVHDGLRIAIHSSDPFRRTLAGGLTAFLVAQSMLIMGGNLRLLPLTGVTLPFVSYGGSSLLVSFVIVILLLHISVPTPASHPPSVLSQQSQNSSSVQSAISNLATFLFIALAVTSGAVGWWAYARGSDLLARTDNPRRALADRYVKRGSILDRRGDILVETTGQTGYLQRLVRYPDLGPIIGYSHPVYGQSGLEASLDPILRGIQGNHALTIWWNHLVYGQPPPGLDIRLTLDLKLQRIADNLLTGHTGAFVLLNAANGEILIMASHPTFNPNQLDEQWDALLQDPQSPLLNRVTQGSYPTGDLASLPFIRNTNSPEIDSISLRLPIADTDYPLESTLLEIAMAASVLSNQGVRPAPGIVQLMENPDGGWLLLSPLNTPKKIMSSSEAQSIATGMTTPGSQIWQLIHTPPGEKLTWYLGGTTPDWKGLPLAAVLVLEEPNTSLAKDIGESILSAAMGP
jgi:cell division protein FtsW (lipid II flippase)